MYNNNTLQTTNARIEWIDALKGFIIILVCLWHIPNRPSFFDFILTCTTAFRMVTFFFLSGLLFSTKKHNTLKLYSLNKIKSLLLPYIFLSFLFVFLDPRLYSVNLISKAGFFHHDLFYYFHIPKIIINSWQYLYLELVNIFFVGDGSPIIAPLWFVLTLFFVSIIAYYIQQKKYYLQIGRAHV